MYTLVFEEQSRRPYKVSFQNLLVKYFAIFLNPNSNPFQNVPILFLCCVSCRHRESCSLPVTTHVSSHNIPGGDGPSEWGPGTRAYIVLCTPLSSCVFLPTISLSLSPPPRLSSINCFAHPHIVYGSITTSITTHSQDHYNFL